MAKKPDTPCAGGCGQLLWSSKTSLPAGERVCRSCRGIRASRGVCTACGATFVADRQPWGGHRRTCSDDCSRAAVAATRARGSTGRKKLRPCASCQASVIAPRVYCRDCVAIRRRTHFRRKNAIRRGAAKVGRTISITELGERDHWRCHLCRRRVHPALRSPHPRSATFDHLIPVSAGGTDAPENLRLAHRRCNSSRGAGGTVQLMLVG